MVPVGVTVKVIVFEAETVVLVVEAIAQVTAVRAPEASLRRASIAGRV